MEIGYNISYYGLNPNIFTLNKDINKHDEYIDISLKNNASFITGDRINVFIKNVIFECIFQNNKLMICSHIVLAGDFETITKDNIVYTYESPKISDTNMVVSFNHMQSYVNKKMRISKSENYNLIQSMKIINHIKEFTKNPNIGDLYFSEKEQKYFIYINKMLPVIICTIIDDYVNITGFNGIEAPAELKTSSNKILKYYGKMDFDTYVYTCDDIESLSINDYIFEPTWVECSIPKCFLDSLCV